MNELDAFTPARRARVEIIPLIDVLFFLLATFVLFTLSLDKNLVLDVPLPKGGTESSKEGMTLYIQASESGTYYWKKGAEAAPEVILSPELRAKLLEYRSTTGQPRVFIRSDNKAKLGDAVLVLDEVRRAGIKEVSIETLATRTGN